MNKKELFFEKDYNIRHQVDENKEVIYFPLIDIIENLGLSKDSRNYWKVLKNRLKKAHPELVTACNQLRMLARDGKYYQTDTSTSSNILKIIQIISPDKFDEFRDYFSYLNKKYSDKKEELYLNNNEISTVNLDNEGQISIDMFLENNLLIVKAMIAGTNPENIFISVSCNKLTLKGSRLNLIKKDEVDYLFEELFWGKFSRVISLPKEIDIDQVETKFNQGLLTIKLPILDKEKTKILKIHNY